MKICGQYSRSGTLELKGVLENTGENTVESRWFEQDPISLEIEPIFQSFTNS